jgi:hypothetical protein
MYQTGIRGKLTRKMQKTFGKPTFAGTTAWQTTDSADVTDANRQAKDRSGEAPEPIREPRMLPVRSLRQARRSRPTYRCYLDDPW